MEQPTKNCERCNNVYVRPYGYGYAKWNKRKYCSKRCGDLSKKTPWLEKYQIQKGQILSSDTQFKSGSNTGKSNVNWKGKTVGYGALHIWIARHYGKPQECESCGTTEKRMYHWANISKQYKRERSDWLRLCVPCHKKMDVQQIFLLEGRHAFKIRRNTKKG